MRPRSRPVLRPVLSPVRPVRAEQPPALAPGTAVACPGGLPLPPSPPLPISWASPAVETPGCQRIAAPTIT